MQSVSGLLQKKRIELGLSIPEFSKRTKISIENIGYIERGDWQKISSIAYARGMVGKYASAMGMDVKKVLTLLKRELDDENVTFIRTSDYEKRAERTTMFSKNTLLGIFILVCILFFIAQLFVFWQHPLLVVDPTPQTIKTNEPFVLSGKTEPGVLLYLNDERLYQNQEGIFSQQLYLKKGARTILLKAIGPNGKKEEKNITIEVR